MKLYKKTLQTTLYILPCFFFLRLSAQDLRADNMLLFQRKNGGWFKQFHGKAFSYDVHFTASQKVDIAKEVKEGKATIDNKATTKEIRYLVKAYKKYGNPKYLAAAERGIHYLLKAQYKNGGWPQYYPDTHFYRAEITYNDNAMVNVLNVMHDVMLGKGGFDVVDRDLVGPCRDAFNRGIDCILKTQILVDGTLTAWCQQYNEKTLQPAKARSYELPSISGSESVGIVELLMTLPHPSESVRTSVKAAVKWLEQVKIKGYKLAKVSAPGTAEGFDKQLVADPASTIWARYYEIGTNRPFFCGRDGIKKYSIKNIGYERRNGYAWYGHWAQKLLDKEYPKWVAEHRK